MTRDREAGKPAPFANTVGAMALTTENGRFDIHAIDASSVGRAIATFAAIAAPRRKLWHRSWQPAWIACNHQALDAIFDEAVRDGRLVEIDDGMSARAASGGKRTGARILECAEGRIEVWPVKGKAGIDLSGFVPSPTQRARDDAGTDQGPVDGITTTACPPALWARTLEAWRDLASLANDPKFQGYRVVPHQDRTMSKHMAMLDGGHRDLFGDERIVADHLEAVSLPLSFVENHPGFRFEVPRSTTLKAAAKVRRRKAKANLETFVADTGAGANIMAAVARMASA